jgi:membrane-bound serine protease (ClpP class)
VVLIVLGLAALAVELFLFPTGGVLAIGGLLAIGTGLVLAFMPDSYQFQPSDVRWGGAIGDALVQSLFALAVLTVGAVVAITALPHSRAMRTLASATAIDGTAAGTLEAAAANLAGRRAVARTVLRPSGFVTLDGRDLPAVAEHGVMLPAGAVVEVVEARLGELLVRQVEGGGAA